MSAVISKSNRINELLYFLLYSSMVNKICFSIVETRNKKQNKTKKNPSLKTYKWMKPPKIDSSTVFSHADFPLNNYL